MKRCLITPLYKSEFECMRDALPAYERAATKYELECAIITDSESASREWLSLLPQGAPARAKLYSLAYILSRYDIHVDPAELLKKVGTVSYTMLKNLYAMHFLGHEENDIFDLALRAQPPAEEYHAQAVANCSQFLGLAQRQKHDVLRNRGLYTQRIVKKIFAHFHGELFHAVCRYASRQASEAEKELPTQLLYELFISRDPARYDIHQHSHLSSEKLTHEQ